MSTSEDEEKWKQELLEIWRIWGGIDRQRRVKGNSSQRQQLSNRKTEYIQNKVGSPSWIERWIFHSLLGGLSKRQIDQILKKKETKRQIDQILKEETKRHHVNMSTVTTKQKPNTGPTLKDLKHPGNLFISILGSKFMEKPAPTITIQGEKPETTIQ